MDNSGKDNRQSGKEGRTHASLLKISYPLTCLQLFIWSRVGEGLALFSWTTVCLEEGGAGLVERASIMKAWCCSFAVIVVVPPSLNSRV